VEDILWFDENDFLFAGAAFLDNLSVVVIVTARTGELWRPQEQIDTSITRAVWTLRWQLNCSILRLLLIATQCYDRHSTTTTCSCEPISYSSLHGGTKKDTLVAYMQTGVLCFKDLSNQE